MANVALLYGILAKLSPFFGKGVTVIVCAFVLFIGSIYLLLSAVFGLRMGYLVLAVCFFGWMIILSSLWTLGAPGTPRNLGPRGVEPHWVVEATGTGTVTSQFPQSTSYPGGPWHAPDATSLSSVDTVKAVFQTYLQHQAATQLAAQGVKVCDLKAPPGGDCFFLDPTTFQVQDVEFATDGSTHLVAGHGFYSSGGPEITLVAAHEKGNVPVYSVSFLLGSLLGFGLHLPLLDRAERKRKDILTGGTAPAWFGPA
ncbi:MAG TPA: hypothetical protein DIT48_12210 [Actinobacteria bacterium]|nr:hypothetical protein [Actinomycetota bacterium]